MKWSDARPAKAYMVLVAILSLVIAALANGRWGP